MPGYHHPRYWRLDNRDRWRAVGADNHMLNAAVGCVIDGIYDTIQVRLCNAQIIRVRPLTKALPTDTG